MSDKVIFYLAESPIQNGPKESPANLPSCLQLIPYCITHILISNPE